MTTVNDEHMAAETPAKVNTEAPARPAQGERLAERFPYPTVQYVAPFKDGVKPTKAMFVADQCYDLSSSGISYMSPRPVECEKLIFALGTGLDFIYVVAEVVHCVPVGSGTSLKYRVGCRFLDRIEL